METIIFSVTIGLILAIVLVGIGVVIAHASERNIKDNTKCECDNNSILRDGGDNMRDRVVGDYNESINSGQDMELEDKAERAIIRLNTIRAGATRSEVEAIDFATECIEVRMRLERFFKERSI